MNALQFEAVKVALKQDRTGIVITLCIHPDEFPPELLADFVGARYGVAMVRITDDESATRYNNRVKSAGMLCRSRDFQFWLKEKGLLTIMDEDEAVAAMYKICEISSRTELNGNADAKSRFDNMVAEYEQSKKEPF